MSLGQGQRVAVGVAVGVAAFLVLAVAGAVYEKYRPVARRRFLIPESFTGKLYLVHGRRRSWLHAVKARAPETINVPEDGILVVGNSLPDRYADTYFDVYADGTLVALKDVPAGDLKDVSANEPDHRRIVFNASSELAHIGQCTLDVESFYIGSPAALLSLKEDDRLDRFLGAHPEVCSAKCS